MPTNNTPAGDSLISNLPQATPLLGTEQIPLDSVISGTLTTARISTASLAAQLLNLAPLVLINDAQITNSTIDSTVIGGTTPSTAAFTTLTANGQVTFTAGTASSSTTTGTLVVTGGVGVSGSVNVGGSITANSLNLTNVLTVANGGTGQGTLTQYGVLLGEGVGSIGAAVPGTSGQMLLSTGATSNPAFGNNPVITGGTINNAVIGGTTAVAGTFTAVNATSIGATTPGTGAFTTLTASSGINSTNIGATTPGTGSFTTLSASGTLTGFPGRLLNVQIFTSSGTYTPTTGTNSIIVEAVGGGGGSGGCAAQTTGSGATSQSSGGGSYAKVRYTSGITTETISIGGGGAAGASGANNGSNGGTTSFGSLVSCPGGVGGLGGGGTTTVGLVVGIGSNASPTISGGTVLLSNANTPGFLSITVAAGGGAVGGNGGGTPFGAGGIGGNNSTPSSGFGDGAGAGAGSRASGQGAIAGAAGIAGVVIVYEYA
jgi:hypothetical protein